MTTEHHEELTRTIAGAKRCAESNRLHIAVVDQFYSDEERFAYCPCEALATLYRPGWFALVGIAYPSGQYLTALEVVDELERASR